MTHDNQNDITIKDANSPASDKSISRKEFVHLVLKRGAIAGAIVAAPKIIDKFLVPPVYAGTSTQPHGHLA
ncbi:MAG: hypothetical protein K2Y22_13790 [Candidatus Obscuribacterales bacterium]|nr:hypothetical protein [Candidatus Obscuribacterales bacterium]